MDTKRTSCSSTRSGRHAQLNFCNAAADKFWSTGREQQIEDGNGAVLVE